MSLLEPPQHLVQLLRESLGEEDASKDSEIGIGLIDEQALSDGTEDIVSYVAFLAAGLCDAQEFTPQTWIDTLQPYMDQLSDTSTMKVPDPETILNKFREAAEKSIMGDDDQESYGDHDDEGYEEVCDLRFK